MHRFTMILAATGLATLLGCSGQTGETTTPAKSAEPMPMGEAIGHFHPKGKAPSKHTVAALEQARKTLPFSDQRDFEEQKRGFIASPSYKKIMADAGNVAWDMERYDWLVEGENFESVHPSLERQS
ncbi:MAG: MBL fold metallo-hydrolase, partial [Deltaproteobacteria bacterium]